jgi:hypothetical protein
LAKQERKYVQNYADAKTVVIEEIIVRALVDRKRMKPAPAPVSSIITG